MELEGLACIEIEKRKRKEVLVEGRTLYKKKGVNVLPADVGYDCGEKPGGDEAWREKRKQGEWYEAGGQFVDHIIPKFSTIERGATLRPIESNE